MLRITRAIWLTILLVPTAASATTESSIQMGGGPIAVDQGRGHERLRHLTVIEEAHKLLSAGAHRAADRPRPQQRQQ